MLVILEKLCLDIKRRILFSKINMIQYGFIKGGDINIAIIMLLYNTNKEKGKKHLLIDVKKLLIQ